MISQYPDEFDPHRETGPDGLPSAGSAAWRVGTRFETAPPGGEIDLTDGGSPDGDDFFIAVSE